KKITETNSVASGEGLPGRVLSSKKPAWIIDVTKDLNFPRSKLAKNLGVQAGFAFPVMVRKQVAAVLEFFSENAEKPNHQVLELMGQIGTQLGRIIEREDAANAIINRELKIRQTNERLESFMNSATDHFIMLDKDLNVIDLNGAALVYFQAKKYQLIGKKLQDISPVIVENGRYEKYKEVIKTGKSFFVDDQVSHRSLGYLRLNVKAFKVADGLGIISSDITGVTDAIDELSNFMYRISHDLKAPLATMMGLVNIAGSDENEKSTKEYLEMIRDNAQKLDDMISDLVALTKVKQTEVTPTQVNLKRLITETIVSMSHVQGYDEMNFEIDIKLHRKFYSDETLVRLILLNLIDNAIKYRRRDSVKPEIKITARYNDRLLKVQIEDNGIGIPKQAQVDVFKMFIRATNHVGGSGIGLYTVKNAVNKLKGTVVLESNIKEGTKFTIYLENLDNISEPVHSKSKSLA
ncbi:MAG TPA: GHKL domain-containing protein, partial [Flavobacteriales bacterium]|nr:GHKL domain-containing protein [Flavobacteriales bacterium]HIO73367.1 GHKL domain-containing protein [Flavobacteriales bacterium]